MKQAKYDEAEGLFRLLASAEEALGPAHRNTLATMNSLAELLRDAGQVRRGGAAVPPFARG